MPEIAPHDLRRTAITSDQQRRIELRKSNVQVEEQWRLADERNGRLGYTRLSDGVCNPASTEKEFFAKTA